MANIREKQKDGKIFSFSFTACLERDAQGKQVRRYTYMDTARGTNPFQSQESGRAGRRRLGG